MKTTVKIDLGGFMNRRIVELMSVAIGLVLVVTQVGCGQTHNNAPTTAATTTATTPAQNPVAPTPGAPNILAQSAAQTAAVAVLNANCLNCHETILTGQAGNIQGAVVNINNPQNLVSSGLVIPGNPNISPLVQVVMTDEMPITGPLSDADKMTLYNWVLGVGSPAGASTGGGTGGGTTGGTAVAASQIVTILTNSCLSCHGAGGNGGVSNITNLAGLVSGGLVVPGNANGSPLYTAISSGIMPIGSTLPSASTQAIAQWINEGAPAQ